MQNTIIVLSGLIAVGKSTIASALAQKLFGAKVLRTRELIAAEAKARSYSLGLDRKSFQDYGDKLDAETQYRWMANRAAQALMENQYVVIDSVRKLEQVERMREWWDIRVFHVHIEANPATRSQRYATRGDTVPLEVVSEHPNERAVHDCRQGADLVLDNTCMATSSVVRLILAYMGESVPDGKVDAIVGGQYGSEGKGHVVSYIAPEYDTMVRVGGPNAGHTVLHPESNEKVSFYHLPSGALHMNGPLLLGPGANINLDVLKKELQYVDPFRVVIDPQANIITTGDIAGEGDLVKGIGSTGQGVGHATARKILNRGRGGPGALAKDYSAEIKSIGCRIHETVEYLEKATRLGNRVLLEGTQGTGLSLHHGPYPYVTSRDTTVTGTAAEAGVPARAIDRVYMVCRTNPIRVQSPEGGTSGPMSHETDWETVAARAGVPADTLREREKTTTTKRQRRVSEFDWELLYRSALLNRPTDIALTFTDYLSTGNQNARRYEQLSYETQQMVEGIERVSGAHVSLIVTRFHKRSIIDRRAK